MELNKENIELRSDKVRNIIGQVPPWLIRSGISVISLIIMLLLIGSYFFKYPENITTTVEFIKKDNYYKGIIKIPANEVSKIKKGQIIEIQFESVKNLNGFIFKSKIKQISNNITISNGKGFYTAEIDKIPNLKIKEKTIGIAKIKTKEISFLDRMIRPFKILKDK